MWRKSTCLPTGASGSTSSFRWRGRSPPPEAGPRGHRKEASIAAEQETEASIVAEEAGPTPAEQITEASTPAEGTPDGLMLTAEIMEDLTVGQVEEVVQMWVEVAMEGITTVDTTTEATVAAIQVGGLM
jgi:hypothetical protein